MCAAGKAGAERLIRERTAWSSIRTSAAPRSHGYSTTCPARGRAERGEPAFGTVDTWLTWQLTGNRTHVADVSNASRTLLFNILENDWDPELLQLLKVPRPILPDVHPSAHRSACCPRRFSASRW